MDKIKSFVLNNKKYIIIGLIILIILIGSLIGIKKYNDYKEEEKQEDKISKAERKKKQAKKELEKELNEIGKIFYEDFYYLQVGKTDAERISFVKRFTSTGITTTLANIEMIKTDGLGDRVEKFKNPITDEDCDKEKTKIKIIPEEPFGKEDYKIELNLVCDLD